MGTCGQWFVKSTGLPAEPCKVYKSFDLYTKEVPVSKKTSDGGSTSYYKIPEGTKDLQDLIELKGMNFSVGNIFKAAYRLGEKAGNDLSYDLRKIIFFAQRELDRITSDSSRNGAPE